METGKVAVGGLSLYLKEAGEGRPVLFVHGNLGSSAWWRESMDIPGWRCVAPEMPNFGRSDPIPSWSPLTADLGEYAGILGQFIETVFATPPVVVAHSLGGGVASALVSSRPELVRALVLVDSASPSGLATPGERYPVVEAMRSDPKILAKALRAAVPTMADESWFADLVSDARLMAAPAWIGNAAALTRFDLRGKLSGFEKPVLVVWGRKDVIVTEAMARETADAFPRSRLSILEAVGHSVMVEDPPLFRELLVDFLSACPE